MGQMFFNIGQLADFLIADKAISKSLPTASPSVKFEDYIKTLTAKTTGQTAETPVDLPDFENIIAQTGKTSGTSSQNSAALTLFDVISSSPETKAPDQLTALLGGFIAKPSEGNNIPVSKPSNNVIESFEQSSLKASEIKDLINSQVVPVKLELDKVDFKLNSLPIQDSTTKSQKTALADTASQYSDNLGNKNELLILLNLDAQNQLSNQAQINIQQLNLKDVLFTADQLFASNNDKIQITGYDDKGRQHTLDIKPENLQQLVDSYNGKLLVEAKSPVQPDVANIRIDLSAGSKAESPEPEKTVIFDLKSLIKAQDIESVAVINKTAVATTQHDTKAVAENANFNYLISQSSNRKQSIKPIVDTPDIKTASSENISTNQSEVTNFADQKNQVVKRDHESDDNNKDSKASSKSESNTQTSEPRNSGIINDSSQTTKAIATQAVAKLSGGEEINALNHADMKVSAAIDSRNSGLMFARTGGEVNIDTAESIVEQLKSQLTSNSHGTRMIIDLKPESLGKIRIDFKYHGDKVEALFKVDHSDIKMLLDSELNKLKNDFRIDSYKVEVNSQPSHNSDTYQQKNPYFNGERNWYQGSRGSSSFKLDYKENPDTPIKPNPIKQKANSMVDLFV